MPTAQLQRLSDLFRNSVLADVTAEMRSLVQALIHVTVPYEWGTVDRDSHAGGTPHGHEGRDRLMRPQGQEPQIAGNPQELGTGPDQTPPPALEGAPPGLGENTSLLFKAPPPPLLHPGCGVCRHHPRKGTQVS